MVLSLNQRDKEGLEKQRNSKLMCVFVIWSISWGVGVVGDAAGEGPVWQRGTGGREPDDLGSSPGSASH